MTIDDYGEAIGLPSGGAVRASLGLASDFADINRFSAFASEFVDLNTPQQCRRASNCPLVAPESRPSRDRRPLTASGGIRSSP